jgi:large subunit ribosomal protein L25
MADATLTAEVRSLKGKGPAGRTRREGLVPAVVYGLGAESVSLSVPARDLGHILSGASGTNTLISLKVDGSEQLTLIRQIQRHPVKGTLTHVDFVRVRADQTIQAEVPVHLVGESEGVLRGGVLEQVVHSLSIEALPRDVPTGVELSIAGLEIGDGVYVRDIAVPAGVTVLQDADELVAQVSAPRVAEEAAAEGEGAEGEAAEGAPAAAAEGGDAGSSE